MHAGADLYTPKSKKKLVGIQLGMRESTQSCYGLLVDLRAWRYMIITSLEFRHSSTDTLVARHIWVLDFDVVSAILPVNQDAEDGGIGTPD